MNKILSLSLFLFTISCNKPIKEYPSVLHIDSIPYSIDVFSETQLDTCLNQFQSSFFRFSDKLIMQIRFSKEKYIQPDDTVKSFEMKSVSGFDTAYISFYKKHPLTIISYDEALFIDPYFVNGLKKFEIINQGVTPFICRKNHFYFLDIIGDKKENPASTIANQRRSLYKNMAFNIKSLFKRFRSGTISVFDENYQLERNIHFLDKNVLFYSPLEISVLLDKYVVFTSSELSMLCTKDESAIHRFLYFIDINSGDIIYRSQCDNVGKIEAIDNVLYLEQINNKKSSYKRIHFNN